MRHKKLILIHVGQQFCRLYTYVPQHFTVVYSWHMRSELHGARGECGSKETKIEC